MRTGRPVIINSGSDAGKVGVMIENRPVSVLTPAEIAENEAIYGKGTNVCVELLSNLPGGGYKVVSHQRIMQISEVERLYEWVLHYWQNFEEMGEAERKSKLADINDEVLLYHK